MGRLHVTICGARKLNDNQVIGIPDPYAKIRMGSTHYKTKTIENNLNPEWNETFVFQVADDNSAQLVVELWNNNLVSDDLMGLYTLSVGNLTRGVVVDNWFVMTQTKTNAELHMRVLAVDFGKLPDQSDQWKVTTDINNDPQLTGAKPGNAGYGGQPNPGYAGQPTPGYGGQPTPGYAGQPTPGYAGQPTPGYGGQPTQGYGGQPAYGAPGPQGFGGPMGHNDHHHHHHHHQHESFQGGPGFQGGPPPHRY